MGKIYFTIRVGLRDLAWRSLLAYRLSRLLHEPVPKTKLLSIDSVVWGNEGTDFIAGMRNHQDVVLNSQQFIISEYQGIPLKQYLRQHDWNTIRNLDVIVLNFVFNLWIGNYDKKDDDYVVNDGGYCYTVDYDLFGPCFYASDELSLGANARAYSMDQVEHTGCCLGQLLVEYIKINPRYDLDFFKRRVYAIQKMNETAIRRAFTGLVFYRESSDKQVVPMDKEQFIRFLLERQKKLIQTLTSWFDGGMPRKEVM